MSVCASVFKTSEMLFEFNAKEFIETAPILGPLIFSLFILAVVFISMNIFSSMINESCRRVRENKSNHEEMYLYIWKKFLHWIGWKTRSDARICLILLGISHLILFLASIVVFIGHIDAFLECIDICDFFSSF